tara:strand:- start:848 stop:1930 length:1083 start_codon:yes stop_codon:yes gene_type:complete
MAYVNVNNKLRDKKQPEPKKATALDSALELTKTGINASNYLNTRNERLLSESGYLDLKVPQVESSDPLSPATNFNMFDRKAGKGPLRGAKDRIKLSDEGKKYFENIAGDKTFAREEYLKWAEEKGLDDVNLGGWGLSNKKIEKLSGDNKSIYDKIPGYKTETFKDLSGKSLDDFISKKPEVKEGMKSALAGDVPLYDESMALSNAAKTVANQAESMIGPFAPEISGTFKDTTSGLNSLIKPMTGVTEPSSTLGIVTSGIKNDAQRWMNKGRDFLGTPSLNTPLKEDVIKGTGLLNTPLMKAAIDPKKAVMDKAMSSVGIKPNLLSGLGPAGWLAQMALGQLGQKIFKPHTAVGKLFKNIF